MSTEPAPTAALAKGEKFTRPLIEAFRRGDAAGMLLQLGLDKIEGPAALAVRTLAELGIETRRESISVLGSHEAFVRRTAGGDLRQVIMPVRLSLAEKTLYQIPIRKPHDPDTGEVVNGNYKAWQEKTRKKCVWQEVVQTSAEVSYQGFLRLNGVAGCAVGQPPSVMVDGVERTNPYLQRVDIGNGRLGDIIRVVIALTVVGPTPATGNPVVVNYTLDYDPAKDLQHMMASVADDNPNDCYLVDESDLEKKPGWKFVPLYGGVGYYVNLRTEAVRKVYAEFTNILQNGLKKAQTIARRNAMKSHPALAYHTVEVDRSGRAVVAIVGWAGDQSAMDRWTQLISRLSRGQTIEAESVSVSEVYDAEKHRAGEADGVDTAPPAAATGIDPELERKNLLIESIDNVLPLLPNSAIGTLGYTPATMSYEELQSVLARCNAILDHQ